MNRNIGERAESGMELGHAVRVICLVNVTMCNFSFDDCFRSTVPKGQRAVLVRNLVS